MTEQQVSKSMAGVEYVHEGVKWIIRFQWHGAAIALLIALLAACGTESSPPVGTTGGNGNPVVTPLSDTWVVGVAGLRALGATGGTPPYTAWSSTSLPSGVTLDRTLGILSGTVTAAGSYSIDVTVTDSEGNQGTGTVTLDVISLAQYEGTWTGIVQGGPYAGKRLGLLLTQVGLIRQATLGGQVLASLDPAGPAAIQFTYDTTPGFVGLNALLAEINWHLVCALSPTVGDFDCTGHDGFRNPAVAGTVVLKQVSPTSLDTQPPTITSTTPLNGASGVTPSEIRVVFDELMSSTGGGTALLISGGATAGVASYLANTTDAAGRTLVVPLSGLQNNTAYTVILNPPGSPGLIDLAGNPLATATTTFTTGSPGANQPPTANSNSYTALIGTPLAITLTGSDPEGGQLTYTVVSQPTAGNLSGTGQNLTYNPVTTGSDSFTFIVIDPLGSQSAAATITLTVQAHPVALDQFVSVDQDTSKTLTLTAQMEPGATIAEWTIVNQPTHGVLTGSGSSRTYTPDPSFVGADSFTFAVTDSRGLVSTPATVTITVSVPGPVTAFDQSIMIRRRIGPLNPAQWAIQLTGSPSAVRFRITRFPDHRDSAYSMDFVLGTTYQTGYDPVAGSNLPPVTAETSSHVDMTTGDITVDPPGSPSWVVFTGTDCRVADFAVDSLAFVAIDANGSESAPATVTITVASSSCPFGTH